MIRFHTEAAAGRWFQFSVCEQMGNIGSEVSRAARWQRKDEKVFQGAVERALELFDLILHDPRWRGMGRRFEIARARELFCAAAYGGEAYGSTLDNLMPYFDMFVRAARGRLDV